MSRSRRLTPWAVAALLATLRILDLEEPRDPEAPLALPESGAESVPSASAADATSDEPDETRLAEPALEGGTAPPADSRSGPGPATVPPHDELCGRIADRLASVAFDDCRNAGFAVSSGASVGGLPLIFRDVSADSPGGPLGRVLLIGGIHGDELSSVSIVFRWNRLLESSGSGPFDWRVVPALNPDGLLREGPSRVNANGVDLNRNFPTPDWQATTRDYWVRRTSRNPRRYPGEAALSEPESRWLHAQIESFQPDVLVSVHAPHGVLDFDGPPRPPERLGSLNLRPIGTYPGSLGRYAGVQSGRRVVTIELSSAGIMPSAEEQRRIWEDLKQWLEGRFLVDTGRDGSVLSGTRASAGR